ncbi:MAG: hypothetical protein PHY29_01765 [Syntrophales bacterium]|nr:hypothetical protein [Syntrophales bacterium]
MMVEKALEDIAEKILALDEASLTGLWEKYKTKLEHFEATREWERATIIFFIINSVKVKNSIFNKRIIERQSETPESKKAPLNVPYLKRIK